PAIGYPFFNTAIPHKRHLTKGSCICWPAAVIPYPGEASSRLGTHLIAGDYRPLGKNWVQAFVKRNPSIKVKRSRSIDSRQVQAIKPANRYNIVEWGDMHMGQIDRLQSSSLRRSRRASRALAKAGMLRSHARNLFPIDKTGILKGKGSNGLVLRLSNVKAI
ncbi:transposase, partial [Colletotrichum incanum]